MSRILRAASACALLMASVSMSGPAAAEPVETTCGGYTVREPRPYEEPDEFERVPVCIVEAGAGFTSAFTSFDGLGQLIMTIRDLGGATLVEARCDYLDCETSQSGTPIRTRAFGTGIIVELTTEDAITVALEVSDDFHSCAFDTCHTSGIAMRASLTVRAEPSVGIEPPRAESRTYHTVPALALLGLSSCNNGVTEEEPFSVCFAVRPGDQNVSLSIGDDRPGDVSARYLILDGASTLGEGSFCGSTGTIELPQGSEYVYVDFNQGTGGCRTDSERGTVTASFNEG